MINIEKFQLCRKWMFRNARPLDIGRWKYSFEHGSAEDVIEALRAFQNGDGGFGHALEADSANPDSSPIQTWNATEILYEINYKESDSDIIRGILNYLDSGKDYRDGFWLAAIPSNNNYPHAPWWSYDDTVIEEWGYNPSVCLAGFCLRFAEKDTNIYKLAKDLAGRAVDDFLNGRTKNDPHVISCYIRFCDYCREANLEEQYQISEMENCLRKIVVDLVCNDTEKWKTDYVCLPSNFISGPNSIFYEDIKKLADEQNDFILDYMEESGSFNVNWGWGSYPEEWPISRNWWKANLCIQYMKYLRAFGKL